MRTAPLGELVADITVGWVGPMADEYVAAGVPFLRTLNIQPYSISTHDLKFIRPEFHDRISKSKLRTGDVVVARTGRPGTAAVVPDWLDDANCSDLVVIRPGGRVHARFLAYYINSPLGAHLVHARNVGSVQIHFNIGAARSLPFPLVPIDEQRRIAAVLGALDDKIELNRRMNRTLEEMAQAIFKSWFVDFDGHDPADMVDTDCGPIPKGWNRTSLGQLADLNPEVWGKSTRPATLEYVDLSNTKWGRIESTTTYAAEDAPSRAQRVLRVGDTIVGTVRPGNGSYALILLGGLTGSTGFAVLRPRKVAYASFVYLAATREDNIERLAHLADGGAYPAVRPDLVSGTDAVRADEATLDSFAGAVDPLLARVAQNEAQSRTLAALRDVLLPKLISGEIRVPEAAAAIVDPSHPLHTASIPPTLCEVP